MTNDCDDLVLVAGLEEVALVDAIGRARDITVAARILEPFPDGELHVEIQTPLSGRDVYVVAATAPAVGERLVAMLLLADACRRAEAASVSAVVPYFGYARQDRRGKPGEPIGAHVLARAIASARFDRLVVVDLHAPALEGDLAPRVEHLTAVPLLAQALASYVGQSSIVVSPDIGAVKLAEQYARLLRLPLVVVHKERLSGSDVVVRRVIGEVAGARPIIIDDMISTGGTVAAAIEGLLERKCAPDVIVAATHGLFVGPAVERLQRLPIAAVLTTDSVSCPPPPGARVMTISLAPLLADAVLRLHAGASLVDLLSAR